MCLKALREGEVADQPMWRTLRSGVDGAVRNGLVAATIVFVATLSWGAPTAAVLTRTAGALLLGVGLYLGVLLAGAVILRVGQTVKFRTPKST